MRKWSLLLMAALACGSGPETWVASVDGVSIPFIALKSTLDGRFGDDPEASHEDVLNQELNRLVSERVVLNRARALGVAVSSTEVQAQLRRLHGEEQRFDAQMLEDTRREMLLKRTALIDLADRVRVAESSLVHYFEDHRERFRRPERAQIRQIVVEDSGRARSLLGQVGDGADFATLAAQHSLAPEASKGGALAPFARGEMPEVFDHAFDLKPGQLSGVLESPYGFHILMLEAKLPEQEAELDEFRAEIRSELEQERLAKLERDWIRELRRTSDIRLNEPLLDSLR